MTISSELKRYRIICEGFNEARQDSPHIVYTDAGKTKKATAAGEFDRVTATLTGAKSMAFTKISKRYQILDAIAKRAAERREMLNEQTREAVDELFDIEDKWITRYVESVSMAITVAKSSPEEKSDVQKFDTAGFLKELYEILGDELAPIIRELEEKYTTIEQITKKATDSKISKVTVKENMDEDLNSRLANFARQSKNILDPVLDRIGDDISNLLTKYGS